MKLGRQRGVSLHGVLLAGAVLWASNLCASRAWARKRQTSPLTEAAPTVLNIPLPELVKAIPELKGLEAAASQERLEGLLGKTGQNVEDFFRTFPDTTSDEFIREQRFRRDGSVDEAIMEEFRYLALSMPGEKGVALQEYRTNEKGHSVRRLAMRGPHILTQGFVSSIIVFDPAYQPECSFRDLGRENWHGRPTEVVAFAQRPGLATQVQSVRAGDHELEIFTQGIAWIDSSNDRIVALRTDLLEPYREIRLDRETTQVEFAPVQFKQRASPMWLPRTVVVTVVWGDQTFRNIHTYSDWRLFRVETREQTGHPEKP
jgi:hypothetical protein